MAPASVTATGGPTSPESRRGSSTRDNDVTINEPVPNEESTSGWGGTLTAYRKLEVSDWRFSLGRNVHPDRRRRQVGVGPAAPAVQP